MSYNGWTNYETWNVALWIDNDPYTEQSLTASVKCVADQLIEVHEGINSLLALLPAHTGDGVPYTFRRVHEVFQTRLADELAWRAKQCHTASHEANLGVL